MRAILMVVCLAGCNQILGGEITSSTEASDDAGMESGADGGEEIGADGAIGDGGVAAACDESAGWSPPFEVGARVEALVYQPQAATIAVSASGNVHVMYASNLDTIHRVRSAGGQWSNGVTWSGVTSGLVAIDSADTIHMFFGENSYTYRPAGGTWSTAVSGPELVYCRSFAAGPSGPIVVGAWGSIDWGAPGTSWTSVQPSIGGACHAPSIALPANGDIHLLAHGYSAGDKLIHAVRSQGGAWTTTVVDSDAPVRHEDSAIAVDSTGTAHFVFSKGATGERRLTYRKRAPGGTATPPIEPEPGVLVSDVAAVIDANDRLHVLYHDRSDENLRYIRRLPTGAWSDPEVVNAPNADGNYVQVVIDGAGRLHAIWTDGPLRLFHSSRCTSP